MAKMSFAAVVRTVILVGGVMSCHAARPTPQEIQPDMSKCNAGRREFCPAIVRCWVGVEEVPCNGEYSDPTLKSPVIYEPPRELDADQNFWVGWDVDFKNSSSGGRLPDPWVSHTNIHIAPADVGALAPPTQHPLRKDSESLTGGTGEYWSNLSLPSGLWLIMAHVRISDQTNPSLPQYEMTIDFVRQTGDIESASQQDGSFEELKEQETFCSVGGWDMFSDCDDFRKAWIGLVSGVTGVFLLLWIQTFFFTDHMSNGHLSLRLEGKRISFLRVLVSFGLLAAVITTNNKFLLSWLHTNRAPARITTNTMQPLRFPNVLLCPFTSTGRLQVLSAVHYPNLYGLSAHQVRTQEHFDVDLVDKKDGTEIVRSCTRLDLTKHHENVKLNVTSEFTTLMVKTIVLDPVRTETDGFGDAMAILYDKDSDLQDVKKFTINLILVGQSAATFSSLSPRVFVDIKGNRTSSFHFTTNAIANPYLRNRDPACKTATSDGVCEREAVLVVNWRTLETELVVEETTLDILTVITLMVGIVSGCRMALELATNLLLHWWHDYLDQQAALYLVGHAEAPSEEDVAEQSMLSLPSNPRSLLAPCSKSGPRRASVTDIVKALRRRPAPPPPAQITKPSPGTSPLATTTNLPRSFPSSGSTDAAEAEVCLSITPGSPPRRNSPPSSHALPDAESSLLPPAPALIDLSRRSPGQGYHVATDHVTVASVPPATYADDVMFVARDIGHVDLQEASEEGHASRVLVARGGSLHPWQTPRDDGFYTAREHGLSTARNLHYGEA